MSWILNVCDSSPNINTKSSCKKECVLLLRVCKESVCRACLNFICKGGLFASVGPELMCKESVYRACLNFICWLLPKLFCQVDEFFCTSKLVYFVAMKCQACPAHRVCFLFLLRTLSDNIQDVLHICYIL